MPTPSAPDSVMPPTPSGPNRARAEAVVATVPKDAFKAMFYLFAGKPDSKVRLLKRKIVVKPEDIHHLNVLVQDKLKLHAIEQCVTSVVVKFDRESSIEFGTWAEFEQFDWKRPYKTRELTVRWDFLIKLDTYGVPQRHTLTVRLSSPPNPQDFLRVVISQDPDGDDDIDGKLTLCIARADFISHRLADELIDVVEEWNEALPQPPEVMDWFHSLEKYDSWIARAVHLTTPAVIAVLALVVFERLRHLWASSSGAALLALEYSMRWLLITLLVIYAGSRISHFLAGYCYRAVNEFGRFSIFRMTSGDANRCAELGKRNQRHKLRFFTSAGGALLLNIIGGILCYWLLPGP